MYTRVQNTSIITAILPEAYIERTLDALKDIGQDVIRWHARGTLQDKRWFRKFIPGISPEKGVIRVLVTNQEVDQVMQVILEQGNLHQQGTGAVYCIPCNELYIGGHFHSSCTDKESAEESGNSSLKENLDVIYCLVAKNQSEPVANAAINAGAHGPIVHYCEGRGLRDRLGWLRITKQVEKEVLTVIVDNANANNIFDAMANAGKLDLPGRGYMYQMPVDKGLFNLPSHFDANRHAANMQQVIGAIDHLMGHQHWRDQTVFEVGGTGKSAGLGFLKKFRSKTVQQQQTCLTAIVDREHAEQIMDMMLDSGAPGLNVNYCQYITADNECIHEGVNLVSEYGVISCIIADHKAHEILQQVKSQTEALEIEDLCLFLQPVTKVMTYFQPAADEKAADQSTHALV